VPGMLMWSAMDRSKTVDPFLQKRWASETSKLHTPTDTTGLRTSRSTLDLGRDRTLYHQSLALWRLFDGSTLQLCVSNRKAGS
jgi:hypothetical protein